MSSILSLNAALLVRPQIMYYNMLLAGALIILAFLKKVKWWECVLYCMVFVLAYGGWSFRNYRAYGEVVYTPIRDKDYLEYYAPLTYALEEGGGFEDSVVVFHEKLYEKFPNFENLSTMEQFHAKKDVGSGYIKSHLPAFLLVNLKGLYTEMIAPGMSEIQSWGLPVLLYWMVCRAFAGCLLLSYLIYAIGFLKTLRRQGWIDWLILLTVMYLMASTAVVGYSRYRLAFYPLCMIGAFSCWKSRGKGEIR